MTCRPTARDASILPTLALKSALGLVAVGLLTLIQFGFVRGFIR